MVETFPQASLTNQVHFQHKTEIRDIIRKHPTVEAGLGLLYQDFLRLYDEEDTVLAHIAKSDFTQFIAVKDRSRDETTMGLFRHIEADCYHFNSELRTGAVGLQNIKNRYSGITQKSLDAQTASTYNMLQELNEKRDLLERLHLAEWVDQLEADNKAVNELMKERDAEKASKPVSRMKEVRPKIDQATEDIYSALETFERLKAFAGAADCIKAINVVNKRYADNLAQAAGQRAAAKKKKEADNDNNE